MTIEASDLLLPGGRFAPQGQGGEPLLATSQGYLIGRGHRILFGIPSVARSILFLRPKRNNRMNELRAACREMERVQVRATEAPPPITSRLAGVMTLWRSRDRRGPDCCVRAPVVRIHLMRAPGALRWRCKPPPSHQLAPDHPGILKPPWPFHAARTAKCRHAGSNSLRPRYRSGNAPAHPPSCRPVGESPTSGPCQASDHPTRPHR